MLALTEQHVTALISAVLSGATLVVVALIGKGSRKRGTKAAEDRAELKDAVQPTNGHSSLGDGLAAIEDRLISGDQRMGRIEVKLDEQNERFNEHIAEVAPLATYVRKQMKHK